VVNASGQLVGMVTQQDLFFGQMTLGVEDAAAGRGPSKQRQPVLVRDVMTSPAVCASEQTGIRKLCRLMYRLRIHRVPIVRRGKLVGIVSSLDVCSIVARGLVNG
jgi:CBS domain-containing protein